MLSNNPFSRPFPEREFSWQTVASIGKVSIFVFAVLYLFRPLGIHFPGNPLLICLGYGVVTFVVGVAYHYVTTQVFGWQKSGDSWTLGKWILDAALLLAFISIANFFYYNATVGWVALSSKVLAYIAVPTVIVGLFPITLSGMAVQLRAERENQRTAGQLRLAAARSAPKPSTQLVELSESGLTVDPNSLLFCEARQNYVRCVFLHKGQVTEETIRATLSSIAEQLASNQLLRCHRSYLVNPQHIRQARGNAQGLKLTLEATSETVPVSRAYVNTFRETILGR